MSDQFPALSVVAAGAVVVVASGCVVVTVVA